MNAENTRIFISEQNKIANFDPLKFLRNGKLELKYKKLWFRLKYPAGRIRLYPLKITDQLAIIEARVYLNKEDAEPETRFIATKDTKNSPGGLYIEAAQHAAIDQALADAGFDIQLVQTTLSADGNAKRSINYGVCAGENGSRAGYRRCGGNYSGGNSRGSGCRIRH